MSERFVGKHVEADGCCHPTNRKKIHFIGEVHGIKAYQDKGGEKIILPLEGVQILTCALYSDSGDGKYSPKDIPFVCSGSIVEDADEDVVLISRNYNCPEVSCIYNTGYIPHR